MSKISTLGRHSLNKTRNQTYTRFLSDCHQHKTVKDIICLGYRLMRKEKLHPHFFGNKSLREAASYLAFYALQLPYEYKNRTYLKIRLTDTDAQKILFLFERRISERIPVEYITQEAYYLGNKFFIDNNVLVPRSLMSTQFNDFLDGIHWENYRVLDLCTGSGCIGISLALIHPKIKVDLVDISPSALSVANQNIKNFALEDRVTCLQSDLFSQVQGKYDLIISNPPYVPECEYKQQPLEVRNEPKIALTAGVEGLDIVNQILTSAARYLNPQGMLIAEVGYSTAIMLKKRYKKLRFKWLKCKGVLENQSIIYKIAEIIVQPFSYLDSIFICNARELEKLT